MKEWRTPGGTAAAVCLDMLKQPHLLIAGSTGSGKSVLINSLIYTALYKSPNRCRFILIDPKRVELVTMDMWSGYRSAVNETMPKATVVVDKFHVVKMATEQI